MAPILRSCCCWTSLRVASFACAVYTLVYFIGSTLIMAHFIYDEKLYMLGNTSYPDFVSFLEPEAVTYSTVIFTFAVMLIGILGFIATCLLVIALIKEQKKLLLPWICIMILDSIVELIHCCYMFFVDKIDFNPFTAIIFTINFFVVFLHVYALLCVISLYQEYSNDPRSAEQERIINVNNSSQGPSIESRMINTVSTQRTDILPTDYSTFSLDTPRASSMRKAGQRSNKGVSFAEETILETSPY